MSGVCWWKLYVVLLESAALSNRLSIFNQRKMLMPNLLLHHRGGAARPLASGAKLVMEGPPGQVGPLPKMKPGRLRQLYFRRTPLRPWMGPVEPDILGPLRPRIDPLQTGTDPPKYVHCLISECWLWKVAVLGSSDRKWAPRIGEEGEISPLSLPLWLRYCPLKYCEQGQSCPRTPHSLLPSWYQHTEFDRSALLSAYLAHVWSVLGMGVATWGTEGVRPPGSKFWGASP